MNVIPQIRLVDRMSYFLCDYEERMVLSLINFL